MKCDTPYDDIIHLPHHISRRRPSMPRIGRAAQFAPFAALSGYDDAVEETARLTDRLLVMNGSKLAMDGTPKEVFTHARELMDMGLSIPQVTQVFLELQKLGLDVESVYTIDQAVEALKRIKGGTAHA